MKSLSNQSRYAIKPFRIAILFLALIQISNAWSPKAWSDFIKSGPVDRNLPDFSYAGYHCGEKPIPDVPAVVNVRDFGAVPDDTNDDTKAINDAIAKAAELGGGAVLIPKGRYYINSSGTDEYVKIKQSNIVLRGEGSGKNGTILHQKNRIKDKKENAAVVFMGGGPGATLTQYTKDCKRGDTIITVHSTSSLKAGMRVEISCESPEIPKTLTHPFAFDKKIGNLPQGHLTLKDTKNSWPVEILEILDETRLRLKQPLRMDQPLGWTPTLKAARMISEVGIENLRIDSSWEGHFAHKGIARDKEGKTYPGGTWHGLTFINVWNGWARNVCIENYNDPYDVISSKCLTLSEISTEGAAGHYFLIFKNSHDNLLRNAVIRAPSVHNIQHSACASGNVSTNCRLEFGPFDPWSGAELALDFHGAMPYENLFEQIDNAYIYGGGDPSVFPSAGVRNTFWNIACPQAIKQNKANELFGVWTTKTDAFQYFPQSFVFGVHRKGGQQLVIGNSTQDQANEQVTVEGLNQIGIEPASLYEAQFKNRIRIERQPK